MNREFEAFRAAHPEREAGGLRYLEAGSGSPVLLLPGAGSEALTAWRSVRELAAGFHVIAVSYPPLDSMRTLADALAGLLDALGLPTVAVAGGSYGGMVAQSFGARHPERVTALVISHSAPPEPAQGRRMQQSLRWLLRLPLPWLRALFRARIARLFPKNHPEAAFSRAQFEAILARWTREDLRAIFARVVEFHQDDDAARFAGPTLLLFGDDDPATPEPVRAALRRRYPQAEVHLFHGTGHAAALLDPGAYYGRLRTFLGAPRPAVAPVRAQSI